MRSGPSTIAVRLNGRHLPTGIVSPIAPSTKTPGGHSYGSSGRRPVFRMPTSTRFYCRQRRHFVVPRRRVSGLGRLFPSYLYRSCVSVARNQWRTNGSPCSSFRPSFDFKMIRRAWRIPGAHSGTRTVLSRRAALQIRKFSTRAIDLVVRAMHLYDLER